MPLLGQTHNIEKIFHCCLPMGISDPTFIQKQSKNCGFFPFEDMLENRKKGWQEFVDFHLHRQNFVNDVSKKNSSLISGTMYAEGWRIAQMSNQIVGSINQNKLNHQMTKKGFDQDEDAAGLMKLGIFLSTVF
ncbi:hypothetical protein PPACK8108_LOCUS15036 [Phakopsora pachyrhizi]|uniref:Tet-like 2OG-Fe(II) oxygenase domain-containing protein n=1 Tax=Phakopsora pachyrhizi TaxID=170000 RepID=A0AAV0B5Z0_PHAPC|nr:hypothetical protein PPACK8108_LOCUS15036 [Phakopsora pachyrhizi]